MSVTRGLDRDLADKRVSSYDKNLEREIRSWIENVTGVRTGGTFHEYLRSGVVLCKLMNAYAPGSCRPQESSMPFKIMENINSFLSGCTKMGIPPSDLFQTVDLYEEKNMNQVLLCLATLKRLTTGRVVSTPVNQPKTVPWAKEPDASTGSKPRTEAAPAPVPRDTPAAAPAASSGPNFCPNCGTKTAGGRFCANCGTKLY